MINLRLLAEINLIEPIDLDHERPSKIVIRATRNGQLMARYCLAFKTMCSFFGLLRGDGEDGHMKTRALCELIALVSSCHELSDIKLRTNEKTLLNTFNNNGKVPKGDAKDRKNFVRNILEGKVKSPEMKINM